MSKSSELPGQNIIDDLNAGKYNPPPIQGEKQPTFLQRLFAPRPKLPKYEIKKIKHKEPPKAKPIT